MESILASALQIVSALSVEICFADEVELYHGHDMDNIRNTT